MVWLEKRRLACHGGWLWLASCLGTDACVPPATGPPDARTFLLNTNISCHRYGLANPYSNDPVLILRMAVTVVHWIHAPKFCCAKIFLSEKDSFVVDYFWHEQELQFEYISKTYFMHFWAFPYYLDWVGSCQVRNSETVQQL